MIHRRSILAAATAATFPASAWAQASVTRTFGGSALAEAVRRIERETGGKFGVAIHDTGSGLKFSHRGDERFPMCSTFKFLLAAAVLGRVDQGRLRLNQPVPVAKKDILFHSPFTETRVGGSATAAELCRATVIFSDNAAANLLLPLVDGPPGLTRFIRTLGDPITRVDRMEPEMNEVPAGDLRDTTSPTAMVGDLRRLLLGDPLRPASRARLTGWLVDNTTGGERLRAGLPKTWKVGDKTGTYGPANNDVAILWPPKRPPVLVASYVLTPDVSNGVRNAAHVKLARAIAGAMTA
jgi:beta-lactamase class A